MQEKNYQNPEIFSQLVRLAKKSGLTQREIAARAGINPVYLNRWLKGKRGLPADSIGKVAEILGVDITALAAGLPRQRDENGNAERSETEQWMERALRAEAKLAHLQRACQALGQHVSALGMTVDDFSKIISE